MPYRCDFTIGVRETQDFYISLTLKHWWKGLLGFGGVGALAAVGLRISGNDGRVKGKKQIHKDRLTVGELLEITGFDRVCAYGIGQLQEHAVVRTDNHFVKAIYQNYCSTILTVFDEDSYRLLTKDQLKCY